MDSCSVYVDLGLWHAHWNRVRGSKRATSFQNHGTCCAVLGPWTVHERENKQTTTTGGLLVLPDHWSPAEAEASER